MDTMSTEELRALYERMRWQDAEREPAPGEPWYISDAEVAEAWGRLRARLVDNAL